MQQELLLETKKEFVAVPIGEERLIDEELKLKIESIPDKMAFKIGEVAEMAGVKPYVLRYWEGEFDVLKPKKSRNNQRMFTRRDVEYVLVIKKLLYRDKYSIEGARGAIKKLKKQGMKAKIIVDTQKDVQGILCKLQLMVQRIENIEAHLK
ncbi:MAG: transcriptional regulator [Bdellovibrionaceae bacterium]|nr:transcriptional regulator [Pseudobdellovibrionaceae bacterium]|tara:strand:- start:30067 stop:30519 length:453 start_codon:yes stop_codon:yes gene_type:complete